MTSKNSHFPNACPLPATSGDTIQLAHGGGGRAMARLINSIIRPAFDDTELDRQHDGATLILDGPLAFTTDSYVVQPFVFPGGDIGTLAINGTVNDLAMCGAHPLYLSVGLILEEGLSIELLQRIVGSMRAAATAAGVRLVTGDTKVVDRGKADGMFINTSGIGRLVSPTPIGPASIAPGDVVILSGDIGRHGMAVMAAREGFGFETVIESDCAPVADAVLALFEAGVEVHCLRDLTRGGLASALVEIAETARLAISIDEAAVPVADHVLAACELLGLDPFHVANEGRFIAIVPADQVEQARDILTQYSSSSGAVVIGRVYAGNGGEVTCRGILGVERAIDMLSGEQLPRIC
ncbi:hydrogenase expression/formation protein HypE [Modicisalibacter xianhensis]|uniref:Hydrogenase expression/formation protein HypE n=1 Tax=Modicisalibacter xianhensis TaxID=442341 RepID=A0A1I2ZZ18_9GAMM|nr:hydrogenase expression/formation protein HypE [Halomonas xianhensis]SFH42915.1 hydrogenase expression/formation protein HypE [Halomonas xianhensis]